MVNTLNPQELRVLGSLIEKEMSTPEYYPLTLNALTNACNQKNNRDPVVAYEETTVVRALDSLREKQLIINVTGAGMRVPKYKHNIVTLLQLAPPEAALLCVLLLRGPQTPGELRGRSAPLHTFENIELVESTLERLQQRETMPLVSKLPRQMGQKEVRFAHLLSGTPQVPHAEAETPLEGATRAVRAENERIAILEKDVSRLKAQVEELQKQLLEFKHQFD